MPDSINAQGDDGEAMIWVPANNPGSVDSRTKQVLPSTQLDLAAATGFDVDLVIRFRCSSIIIR